METVDARAFNEQVPHQQDALHLMRLGVPISNVMWVRRHPGARAAATILMLRRAHGFDVSGNGSVDNPYKLDDCHQWPTKVETTDALASGYYETEHWKETRQRRMEDDLFACVLCNSTDELCVHHILYELFAERLSDLMTVCEICHERIHRHSRLRFPAGMSVEHADMIGVPYSFEQWLIPPPQGGLFKPE